MFCILEPTRYQFFAPPDIRQVPQLLGIISPLSELKNIYWAIFYSVFKKNPKNTRFTTVFCDFLKTLKENFGKLFFLVLGTNSGCYGRKFSLLARSSRSRLFLAKFRWTNLCSRDKILKLDRNGIILVIWSFNLTE